MKRLPVLWLLLWICAVYSVGIYLFVGGFLLVRLEVNRTSTCGDVLQPGEEPADFCRVRPRFRRAVLLIIDALKIDFAWFDPDNAAPRPYENKLPVLEETVASRPAHSRLYPFRADPPTTTMQRIKGFTTGSLPTFVDVGNNFASSAILEDNLIHQFGQDLHTVDNGILQHLYTTMVGDDWDVLVAHFLGVDHCGHRFGPDHPAMADKLTQMDGVIRSVIDRLQNDTLLVVMGDHGMTDTGDHGGESQKETDAAIFLYSPSPLFSSPPSQSEPDVVPQTDLVPTLALLLGVPIPYSSVGQVLLPVFPPHGQTEGAVGGLSQLEALWINAKQVNRFLETYSGMAKDIPPESLSQLKAEFSRLSSEYLATVQQGRPPPPQLAASLQAYLTSVRDTCRATWARFNPLKMAAGLVILALACLACLVLSELSDVLLREDGPGLRGPVVAALAAAVCAAAAQLRSRGHVEAVWCLAAAAFSSELLFLWRARRCGTAGGEKSGPGGAGWPTLRRLLAPHLLVPLLRCASLLSDSYVIAEGRAVTFLVFSLALYIPIRLNWDGLLLPPSHDPLKAAGILPPPALAPSTVRKEGFTLLACLGLLVGVLYLSLSFHACREEQGACQPSPFLSPLSRLQDSRLKNLHYVLSVCALALWTYLLRRFLRHYGNLNAASGAVFAARWVLPLLSVCLALYWAVSATPEDSFRNLAQLIVLAQRVLPRAAFCLVALGLSLIWLDPLTVFTKTRAAASTRSPPPPPPARYRASTGISPEAELHHLIPQIYQRMRRSLDDGELSRGAEEAGRPAVEAYGLGTVYTAPLLLLCGLLGVGLLLLHPEGMALSFLLLMLEMGALLHIHASSSTLSGPHAACAGGFNVPWTTVVLWSLAATQFFHATGHLPTFPSIQWGAAFVGFPDGHTGTVLPASLVTLNTFASHILFSVACPLLLFWPLVCEVRGGRAGRAGGEEGEDAVMEMRLRENPRQFSSALLQLSTRYLFILGAQVFASVCAAAILRRHLMVWKVFAPKLMFEASGFLVSSASLLIGVTLVLRVDVAVGRWFKRLIPDASR
ncbi:GPI ethanolamine phosphate transferase 3 [Liparis tanakae]|uniref:GPI ethanolamine phosphate transferase 3 n=1 Tax=Liparis tanakae TaxID=230148 RepID=A0A4Z2IM72_9TELE|nr:GPI ethanolamine phosphate transferase 3 [Liparis tanakae]